jgi:hypothetical protein
MHRQTSLAILKQVRERQQTVKQAGIDPPLDVPSPEDLKSVMFQTSQNQAWHNVRNLGLLSFALGAGSRGLVGLHNLVRRNLNPPTVRGGPVPLPLPYPVMPSEDPERIKEKKEKRAGGTPNINTPSGHDWYTTAMLAAGLGGGALGWKGVDVLLNKRREQEQQSEMEQARHEFHDALLSQYGKPLQAQGGMTRKVAADASALGPALDRLFDSFLEKRAVLEKRAFMGISDDVWGKIRGGYYAYAGGSGLITGALVYDKMKKRQQRAIVEEAMKRRERKQMLQQPPEIYATPEPMATTPKMPFRQEMRELEHPAD